MEVPNNRITRLFMKEEHLPKSISLINSSLGTSLSNYNNSIKRLFKYLFGRLDPIKRSLAYIVLFAVLALETKVIYDLSHNVISSNVQEIQFIEAEWLNDRDQRNILFMTEKSENMYRIIVLGDSFTYGWGLDISDTYPFILENMLNNLSDGAQYQTINLADPGFDLKDNIDILSEKSLNYNPDLVIFNFLFENDLDNKTRIKELFEEIKLSYMKTNSLNEDQLSDEHMNKIIHAVDETYIEEMKDLTISDFNDMIESSLERLYNMSNEMSFDVVLFFWDEPWVRGYIPMEVFMIFENYGKSKGWIIVTSKSIYDSYDLDVLRLKTLGSHPSPLFNREVAKLLYDEITNNVLN
jgi:hypothetical protein